MMAGAGPTTDAAGRKAQMQVVAARLAAEEADRQQEHRAERAPSPDAAEHAAPSPDAGAAATDQAATDQAAEDDEYMLHFEAEVAATAGRHLAVAKTKAAQSEIAMMDRAEELVSRLRTERDQLSSHLERLKLSSRESSRGEDGALGSPLAGVGMEAEAQAELDRMFDELVGGGDDSDASDGEDDWLSLADEGQVRAAMAAAVGASPDDSRPASGVSDPQPTSPAQVANVAAPLAHATGRVGTPSIELEPEPEPEPRRSAPRSGGRHMSEDKSSRPAAEPAAKDEAVGKGSKRKGHKSRPAGMIVGVSAVASPCLPCGTPSLRERCLRVLGRSLSRSVFACAFGQAGAKPAMDIGAYAAKRAAALAKAQELKEAVELGQRKTEARGSIGGVGAGAGGAGSQQRGESALKAEEVRAAWLAKKKQQDRQKKQAEGEKRAAKQREEKEWQRQREAKAVALGRRRPGSGSSSGGGGSGGGGGGDGIAMSQSLPVLVPPPSSAPSRGLGDDDGAAVGATAPRERLREKRRQRRQSQGDASGDAAVAVSGGRSGGPVQRWSGAASGRGQGQCKGRGGARCGNGKLRTRPESASVRQKKTAASALEVEAATERIIAAEAQEVSLKALLAEAMGDVEAVEAFELEAEARPQSAPELLGGGGGDASVARATAAAAAAAAEEEEQRVLRVDSAD